MSTVRYRCAKGSDPKAAGLSPVLHYSDFGELPCSVITNTLVGILGETAPVARISIFIE